MKLGAITGQAKKLVVVGLYASAFILLVKVLTTKYASKSAIAPYVAQL